LDTNVLPRLGEASSSAATAVQNLSAKLQTLVVVPQVLAEYWAVATRPVAVNGLGMDPTIVHQEIVSLQKSFEFVDDSSACFVEWRSIALRYAVRGKQTHDARLVGAMVAHGIGTILTYNGRDFERYSEISVESP